MGKKIDSQGRVTFDWSEETGLCMGRIGHILDRHRSEHYETREMIFAEIEQLVEDITREMDIAHTSESYRQAQEGSMNMLRAMLAMSEINRSEQVDG